VSDLSDYGGRVSMFGSSDDGAKSIEQAYEELPESVRQYYSLHEYKWMSGEQRARLVQEDTEPDYEEP